MDEEQIAVFIGLGHGVGFGITHGNNLVIGSMDGPQTNLGRCTRKRIQELQDYLGRLAIHAVPE